MVGDTMLVNSGTTDDGPLGRGTLDSSSLGRGTPGGGPLGGGTLGGGPLGGGLRWIGILTASFRIKNVGAGSVNMVGKVDDCVDIEMSFKPRATFPR